VAPRRDAPRRGVFVCALIALVPWLLHGLAREVDRVFGLLLHTTLDVPDLVPRGLALLRLDALARAAVLWTLTGACAWLLFVLLRRASTSARRQTSDAPPETLRLAAAATAALFLPLLVRPALSLASLVALSVRPAYPYGFTLPVALTQDLAWAQDSATLVALVVGAVRALAPRWPACLVGQDWRPRTGDVWLWVFLAYGALAPASARLWDMHPGNEPKYLRIGAALALEGGVDVARISAPIEALPARPLTDLALGVPRGVWQAGGRLSEAWRAGRALAAAQPPDAQVLAHLTVRGPSGGAYHVLAPGPGVLLAPWLRLDRALNRWRGTPGRIALTLLAWQALAAWLVALTFRLASAASGRPGLAALVASGLALLPPLLFYSFQFYPEVPAGVLLVLVLERLLFGRGTAAREGLQLGLLVAALPWLHQKYLPLAVALLLWAGWRYVDRLAPGRALLALVLPPGLSLALFALYNFALTGSLRPDALFRVLGREGVGWATLPQGLLGLALDARYGVLPYVPLLAVGLIGLAWPGARARGLRAALPAAAVYYATVGSAENWTGSISNLGRFVLPLVPLLATGLVLVLADVQARAAARVWLGTLAAWSAGLAVALWRDPRAANDCAHLLAGSAFADGHVYLPNLLWRAWSAAPAGLVARLLVAAVLVLWLAVALRRTARRASDVTPVRALTGLLVALLLAATLLERWPGARRSAWFRESLRLSGGTALVLTSPGRVQDDAQLDIEAGDLHLIVRSPGPVPRLYAVEPTGDGTVARRLLPLVPFADLTGRRGNREVLALSTSHWTSAARLRFELE
jgi:hypothetical protein